MLMVGFVGVAGVAGLVRVCPDHEEPYKTTWPTHATPRLRSSLEKAWGLSSL